ALEVLKEAAPHVTCVAVTLNPDQKPQSGMWQAVKAAGKVARYHLRRSALSFRHRRRYAGHARPFHRTDGSRDLRDRTSRKGAAGSAAHALRTRASQRPDVGQRVGRPSGRAGLPSWKVAPPEGTACGAGRTTEPSVARDKCGNPYSTFRGMCQVFRQ